MVAASSPAPTPSAVYGRPRAASRVAYVAALVVGAVGLVALDRLGTSDDAVFVVLAALLAASGALGFASPRRFWIPALVLGGALGVSAVGTLMLGGSMAPDSAPAGYAGALSLLVLAIPAGLAAGVGAGVRRALCRPS